MTKAQSSERTKYLSNHEPSGENVHTVAYNYNRGAVMNNKLTPPRYSPSELV